MKNFLSLLVSIIFSLVIYAENASVSSPDGKLIVDVEVADGMASYSLSYDGATLLLPSPLGFTCNVGDFSSGLVLVKTDYNDYSDNYSVDRIKTSSVEYIAREMKITLQNADDNEFSVTFRVSNNDVAFRYELPNWKDAAHGKKMSVRIMSEATGFHFPNNTTTFLCPQSDAMIGWKGTKPSYEEEYVLDVEMSSPSLYGHGYTFPCLFRVGDSGWVLISETGVDSHYCGGRLSEMLGNGLYKIAFPMEEENNGNGTIEPAMALPGITPWRTLAVGSTLAPIVETTGAWNNVLPRYETQHSYKYGHGTWSWILWQDESINYDDQVKYIDLAAAMGYEYVLIDNYWDTNIGHPRMAELIQYAHSKGIDVFLWYSSSGYWNDIEQGPINHMDNSIVRKKEMNWLQEMGVKGIKVDFFGGDKQETMRLYEQILSDAEDHGLMVIFHGCTLPRGWERMYPNYVGSEAVLASENLVFEQHFCDQEATNACLHPFIRNSVACMEFGGCFLNHRLNKENNGGTIRRTSDVFELATCVLFQNPIQNFALAPNNLNDAPRWALDYLRAIPTTWDETRFVDGYPGKYVILARRKGKEWYVAGVNAENKTQKITLHLPMFAPGEMVTVYSDDETLNGSEKTIKVDKKQSVKVEIPCNGGLIIKSR